jgi:integrase
MRRKRQSPGTLQSVIGLFRLSDKYRTLKPATRQIYDYGFRIAGDVFGDCPVAYLRPRLMQDFLDRFADRPATQKNIKGAFQSLEKWAIVRELIPHQIMLGTQAPGGRGAREPWSDEQVRLAIEHARPDLARVVQIAAGSGQRIGDIVRMRWTDLEPFDGRLGINVTQQKTGLTLWVPLRRELIAAMDGWEKRPGFIVYKPSGLPYTRPELTCAWLRERARNPALAPLRAAKLSLHGLRATCVIRWRRDGVSALQICNVVGMSPRMVERYSRRAIQRELASAAMDQIEGRERNENKVVQFKQKNDD